MQVTYVLELLKPTNKKTNIIESNILEVCKNRESIAKMLSRDISKMSSKDFEEKLPSAVKNQNIREVKALYKLFKKSKSKKDNLSFKRNQPLCYNNQNYKINKHFISFPLCTNKSKRYWFPVVKNDGYCKLTKHIREGAKLGKASLFRKRGKYYFAVTLKVEISSKLSTGKVMGIDVGLNQLAVASVKDSKNKETSRMFYNGKKVGFIRKKYRSLRRSLGKAKQINKLKAVKDKESRYMTNLNHEISRKLVNLAVQEKVSTIVMENLKNIKKSALSLKTADKNLNSWSFYELQQFVEYKAKLENIEVKYINPKYTSQMCSKCKNVKKSNRQRNIYICNCGNVIHSDLNAARNICDIGAKAVYQQSV